MFYVTLHATLVLLIYFIYNVLVANLVITLDIILNGVILVSYHSKFPQICVIFQKEGRFFCRLKFLYDNIFKEKSLKFSVASS